MKRGTEKLIVLIVSFAVFAAGVLALYSEPCTWRTIVLWGSFSLLLVIALRQTLKNYKKG